MSNTRTSTPDVYQKQQQQPQQQAGVSTAVAYPQHKNLVRFQKRLSPECALIILIYTNNLYLSLTARLLQDDIYDDKTKQKTLLFHHRQGRGRGPNQQQPHPRILKGLRHAIGHVRREYSASEINLARDARQSPRDCAKVRLVVVEGDREASG